MGIELIQGDCMDFMRGLPDKAFELAIVDPPYGIGEDGKSNNSRGTKRCPATQFAPKGWDSSAPSEEYFAELKRVSRNQIIWGANHFAGNFDSSSSCWIVWNKMNTGDFADCELAYASFKTAVRMFNFMWNGMLQGDMKNKEQRIHPTQKPVKLYQWLLSNYAKPGDSILDTHLGSASSAIAAHYGGFDFVGIELDQDYYHAAVRRFDLETRQEALFS